MPLTKYEGLRYPSHFLKSMGSGIMNGFPDHRTKQVNVLSVEMNVYIIRYK